MAFITSQFKLKVRDAQGGLKKVRDIRPYIMDLGSKNGTFLNGDRIESSRYDRLQMSIGLL